VSGNVASNDGGGLALASGSLSLTTSTVSDNRALLGGGGGVFFGGASLTAERSTLSGNRAAGAGGGLLAVAETVATTGVFTNVTVSGNIARGDGGGLSLIFGGDDTATLLNVTVTRNQAANGGGIVRTGGVVQLRNTLVAQNQVAPGGEGTDVAGGCVSLGFNLVGIAEGILNVTPSDQFGTLDIPIDARLAPLADNGGPTLTHALRPGSRAIDRGGNEGAPANDQRGRPRSRDGDSDGTAVIDVGAFEFIPVLPRRRR
jgi:hypothetical protein